MSAERWKVTVVVEVEPTVDAAAVEVVSSVVLGALTSAGIFPERWTLEREAEPVS